MSKVKYALIGFGGIAENRVAKEGFACDAGRFRPLRFAKLVGATDLNPMRESAAKALGLAWYRRRGVGGRLDRRGLRRNEQPQPRAARG